MADENKKLEEEAHDKFLDFSSEIEFDERFADEKERFIDKNKIVGSLIDGQSKIDRSLPEHMRANTKEQRE